MMRSSPLTSRNSPCLRSISSWALALALLAGSATAQEVPLDSMLRAHAYGLHMEEGGLSGPGFDRLMEAMEQVQFVAIGEQHLVRAITEFTSALFVALNENHGFQYTAWEQGPYLMQMLSEPGRLGNRDSVLAVYHRYPNAFHLLSDQELESMASIGAISRGPGPALWGLDQMVGALHVLERLMELAPGPEAREAARALAERAREYEAERFQQNVAFMTHVADPADFDRLAEDYSAAPGSEAAFLIDRLRLSSRIYRPYSGKRHNGVGDFYLANRARERNMKRLFARRYREARAAGDSLPKVLLRFGALHLYRGLSPGTELYTLGNFISELAAARGMESYHILAFAYNPEIGGYLGIREDDWRRPIVEVVGPDGWTLVELAALHRWVRADRVTGLSPEIRQAILAHDAILVVGGATLATQELTPTPNWHLFPEEGP